MPDHKAQIDNFNLDIETIEDGFESSIAKHEFPYSDGAFLENMGQRARTITIRCYFLNEQYESHIFFLDYIKNKKELLELTHPKYGIIKGFIESVHVRHDSDLLKAEIDLTFIENRRTDIFPQAFSDIEGTCEAQYMAAQEEQKDKFSKDVATALGAEAKGILEKVLNLDLAIIGQFTGLSRTAREYVKTVDTYVTGLKATLSDITNPANSLIGTIDFGDTLPGVVIGAVARTMERYSILHDSLKMSPARFLRSFTSGIAQLEAAFESFATHTQMAKAMRAALDLGYSYSEDEDNRNSYRQQEKNKSFSIDGKYIRRDTLPALLTVNEIEQSLAIAREEIQTIIDDNREMQSLKDMAVSLLDHAYTVKIESEKLITVDIDNELPLHLICLKYGLPYQYAERIYSVNRIKHPNFTRGEIKVYAR